MLLLTATLAQSSVLVSRPWRWTCAEFYRLGELGLFEGR